MQKIVTMMLSLMLGLGQLGLATTLGATVVGIGLTQEVAAKKGDFNPICKDPEVDANTKQAAGCKENRKIGNVVVDVINVAIGVVAVIAVVAIIVAGQRLITSSGDPGLNKQAKQMIIYALVGLVVAILAFAIVSVISGMVTSRANLG